MWRQGVRWDEETWLPPELQTARLIFSEKPFFSHGPYPMVAQIDRAYETEEGSMVLVEFKRRKTKRAYLSDIVELSAQRVAMLANGYSSVGMMAFVAVVDPDTYGVTPIEVKFEPEQKVVERQRRYDALMQGNAMPHGAKNNAVCERCGYREICSYSVG